MDAQAANLNKDFVLATDLDGTFLGGPEADRLTLYRWIEDNRDRVGLVFVSGRDLPFIETLCGTSPVPWPDFVIGDVGTTIGQTHFSGAPPHLIRPIPALEEDIARRWRDGITDVRRILDDAPGLKPQATPFRYRMSYHYDPAVYRHDSHSDIESMGYDVLISDNRFLDVLPKGVSKGPSLLRLIEHLSHDPATYLVAGDTLNDLSMFETGLNSVAVGNSEEALLARLPDAKHVYRARGHGARGIMEAIRAFDLFPATGGKKHVV